eukprot:4786906-Amphidinium_carterae.1
MTLLYDTTHTDAINVLIQPEYLHFVRFSKCESSQLLSNALSGSRPLTHCRIDSDKSLRSCRKGLHRLPLDVISGSNMLIHLGIQVGTAQGPRFAGAAKRGK